MCYFNKHNKILFSSRFNLAVSTSVLSAVSSERRISRYDEDVILRLKMGKDH